MRTTKTGAGTTATTREPDGTVRLHVFLARAGVASRRESERLIAGGRVEVNGRTITTPGTTVDPRRDSVRVDGRRVTDSGRRAVYLVYKPRGYITSASDPEGRPTVLDLLPAGHERLYPVGRLDYQSEGLVLLTNDGDLAQRLTHPRHHVPRTYRVKVKGLVPHAALAALRRGVVLDGRRTLPARITPVSGQHNTWLEVVLYEGRRNQIRRMFQAVGHPVLKLRRIAIGALRDRRLRPGAWRALSAEEIRLLREEA
jgi:pseudouridine synthase